MAAGSKSNIVLAALIAGMLITGAINVVSRKVLYGSQTVDRDGKLNYFNKAWFGSLNMLFAMACAGLADKCLRSIRRQDAVPGDMDSNLLAGSEVNDKPTMSYCQKVSMIALPASCDLIATAAGCIGILYLPASVWQMLRGSTLVFVAIMSVVFLKRELKGYHYLGLSLCLVGVTLVALSNILGTTKKESTSDDDGGVVAPGSSSADVAFGMVVVLFGQIVQSSQCVAEEWLMKGVDLPAMVVVGYEGLWGVLIFFTIVYPALWLIPGSDHGHVEDPIDTWVMFKNSSRVMIVCLAYTFSCATFNACGIAITGALSAVHRMMIDASRTMIIWAVGLIVHYCFDEKSPFGEAWTPYSFLQLFGFVVIILGQTTYGCILRWPCFTYPVQAPAVAVFPSPASVDMNLSSPLPPKKEGSGELLDE
jgi:drug/metabolite transporter (DMT)-like permease